MSDITKRQAYVFLQDGDVIQDGDEYFDINDFEWYKLSHKSFGHTGYNIRRPIATPEQTDKLTIEQRVTALEKRLNTQPAEQPSERTCKWNKHKSAYRIIVNPHNDCVCYQDKQDCPTCGRRIEVVE
jgi:hypothetical protein